MPSEHKLNNEIKKKLYFIVFYFYKLIKTEFNYPIYDKKFLLSLTYLKNLNIIL